MMKGLFVGIDGEDAIIAVVAEFSRVITNRIPLSKIPEARNAKMGDIIEYAAE